MPEGLGKVYFANSIILYFVLFSGLGIGIYGTRECAKVRNDKMALSKIASELFAINSISVIIVYIFFAISIFVIPKFIEYRTLLCVSSISIFLSALGIEWLYGALEEYRYIAIRSFLSQLVSLILLFLLVKKIDDYILYAGIAILASAGSNIFNFLYARKYIDLHILINKKLCKHLKPLVTLFIMAIVTDLHGITDTVMLGFILDDTAVGIYTAATKMNKLTMGVITSAIIVFLPRLSFYIGRNRLDYFSDLIHKCICFLLFLSVPLSVGLYLLSKSLIFLFSGQNYLQAVPVMHVMAPVILFFPITNMISSQVFIPLGKEKLIVYTIALGIIVNISLNSILIPSHGIFGSGIARVCSEFVVALFQIIIARKYFLSRKIIINLFQFTISSLCMGIVILIIFYFIPIIIIHTVFAIVFGFLVYIGVLYLMKNAFIISFFRMFCDALSKVHFPGRLS
jgi:O-antigen/teichoic acid export membrane protein